MKHKKEEARVDNSCGVLGVTFGILSILFSQITGIILGTIGLAFSIRQKNKLKNKWSKSGVILNVIGIILGIITSIILLKTILNNPEFLNQIQSLKNP